MYYYNYYYLNFKNIDEKPAILKSEISGFSPSRPVYLVINVITFLV